MKFPEGEFGFVLGREANNSPFAFLFVYFVYFVVNPLLIDAKLGRGSKFARRHGFYADVVTPDIASLPAGWERRLKPLRTGRITAFCLDAHDLLVSKLAAGRLKDLEFAGALLQMRLIAKENEPFGLPKRQKGVNDQLNLAFLMRPNSAFLALFALLGASLPIPAANLYRTNVNPALLYWQAFSQLPELSPEEQKLFDRRRSAPTDETFGALAARYDTAFQLARRAADLKQPADWGIDLADGPYTLLPHLAKAKVLAQAAQLRARHFLHHGKEDDAIRDLTSAFILGHQIANDGVLISTLVRIVIDNIVVDSIAANFYAFSPEGLRRLIEGFDASPAANTVSQCVYTGERSFGPWYRRRIEEINAAHPSDDKASLKEIRELLASTLDSTKDYVQADQFIQSAGGTTAGLLKLVNALDPLYVELQSVTSLPYDRFEAASKAYFKKIDASDNPFVKFLLPALQKARNKEFRDQAWIAMLRAAVQFRLRGEPGFQSVPDPFGSGPFQSKRFTYQNVDRGFELRSNLAFANDPPEVVIFVQKPGPPFRVTGPSAGKPFEDN